MTSDPIPPMLRVSGLTFGYTRGAPVTRGVSFSVAPGCVHAVLGPSGCGKTTLLRLIAGLERPDAGEIRIDSRVVASDSRFVPPEKRRAGMVFQDYAVFPHLSVVDNIAFAMRSGSRASKRAKCEALVERFGLGGLDNAMPHALSGGQLQRVAIARTLASDPKVVLLDEPFTNLDAPLRESLRELVFPALRASGAATVLVTHDQGEAALLSDSQTTLGAPGS